MSSPTGDPSRPASDARVHHLVEGARALGVTLAPAGAAALLRYLDAMLRENVHVNLTAIADAGQALVLHLLDSLAMARARETPPKAALDLGTGNGFPGVAVRALWPSCRLVLCDRTHKKVAAVARALAAAAITDVATDAVDAAQAPALRPHWRGAFDLVTVRAVGKPELAGGMARPLLSAGGTLLLWLDGAGAAPALAGFGAPALHAYDLPDPAPRSRRLAAYRRIRS
jgi:16S rRNA (guanine527-N7)-methyltransferase